MQALLAKAAKIKLAIFDIDGVLTDGKLYFSDNNVEHKSFYVQDGLGLQMLQKSGVPVALLSGRSSPLITRRAEELGIQHVYQGHADKIPAFLQLKKQLQLDDQEIAYIGDDLPDLPLIRRVGLGIAVANAHPLVSEYAAWKTTASGGNGAVREVCELIMRAQKTLDAVYARYLATDAV
jgi:3-deoxy-D-manno-octulosonate 8-phosphate phosphatase (KDO 8-P phosphatase)